MKKNKNFFELIEDEKTKDIIYGSLKKFSQINNFSNSDFLKVSNKIINKKYILKAYFYKQCSIIYLNSTNKDIILFSSEDSSLLKKNSYIIDNYFEQIFLLEFSEEKKI